MLKAIIAAVAASLVVALIGRYATARAAAAGSGAPAGAVGSSWLFSSGTPDAVKDNRATLPPQNDAQWKATADALGSNEPTRADLFNVAAPTDWTLQ